MGEQVCDIRIRIDYEGLHCHVESSSRKSISPRLRGLERLRVKQKCSTLNPSWARIWGVRLQVWGYDMGWSARDYNAAAIGAAPLFMYIRRYNCKY